jgi:hypothetical protein
MTSPVLVLAVLTVGQCYTTPVYYDSCYPATYAYTCGENQIIRNTGPICSKFYTTVTLYDGYRTSIPVINCKYPRISCQTTTGGRTLILDYANGYDYQSFAGKAVKYQPVQKVPQRTPTRAVRPKESPAPAPAFPEDPEIPKKVPQKVPLIDTPGPTGPAPGLTTPTDDQIEQLLNRIERLEKKVNTSTTSPSIQVEENRAESIRVPAPALPTEVTPNHPDNITKPTYD